LKEFVNIGASIHGLKRIRPRILSLYFRSMTRDSEGILASIRGWSNATTFDIGTSIIGLFQVMDLGASINAVRYKPYDLGETEESTIVDIENPINTITAGIGFNTGVNEYIFNPADNKLYSKDDKKWSIITREKVITETFFQEVSPREVIIDSLEEFDSVDEAIRDSLDRLITPHNVDFCASIVARGYMSSLTASIEATDTSKVSDIKAKIMQVWTIPDISASISSTGRYSNFITTIKSLESSVVSLTSTISGWEAANLFATIVSI
jgi:hypothetical protein